MDLASKLVVVISEEDVGELTRHTIQCPEAITSCRGSVVEVDRGELCDHECPSRAGRVLKDVRVRQWTFQGFGHFSGARDGKTAQGLQGLLRIHLVDYKGENASAETCPYPSRLDGIHLPEHPGDSVGRHGADHCVSTGAGQTCDDAPHVGRVQVSQPFPSRLFLAARIRSRTSPAIAAATSSEIACGCALYLYPRWAFAQVCPVGPALGTHPCTVLVATGKRWPQRSQKAKWRMARRTGAVADPTLVTRYNRF